MAGCQGGKGPGSCQVHKAIRWASPISLYCMLDCCEMNPSCHILAVSELGEGLTTVRQPGGACRAEHKAKQAHQPAPRHRLTGSLG